LVRGDFDRDGAEDLLVTSIAGSARLYRNVAPKRGHWLKVRLVDQDLKRDAYGAEIRVHADGRTWSTWFNPAESYLCSSEAIAHIGLGLAAKVDSIQVLWPDRAQVWEEFDGCGVDQLIEIRKGKGQTLKR